jgi:ATP-binding dynein motor region
LKDLEEKILRLLHQSEGSILDDEILINTLRDSKETSNYVQMRVKEAEETEQHISIPIHLTSPLHPTLQHRIEKRKKQEERGRGERREREGDRGREGKREEREIELHSLSPIIFL